MSDQKKSAGACQGCCCGETTSQNFDDLITQLKKLDLQNGTRDSQVAAVQKLMDTYVSKEEDFKRFVFWSKHKYTRNLVDDGNGKFNFLILCWGESQGSLIHSHEGASCMMKILKGDLKETRYTWPKKGQEAEMQAFQTKIFKKNDVTYINDDIGLHQVENPSHVEGTVSLHMYWPPFDECSVFDSNTGKEGRGKMQIWSKNGQLTEFGKDNM